MIQDIRLFTSQPKAAFYDTLFLHLDLSELEQQKKCVGRTGYPAAAMLCAFVVTKCEGFGYITDLVDYLEKNVLPLTTVASISPNRCRPIGHMTVFSESWIISW